MEQLLALEMVRVTEAAAIASARFMGRGARDEADQAATEAMRRAMDETDLAGTIVIGEGERDEAPMLYIGEQVGRHDDGGAVAAVDIAVDPLEGTNLVATGQGGALTVLAASETGGLTHAPDTYLEKLAVGPVAAGCVDITRPPAENCHRIAEALRRRVSDITVIILDRPRHADLIAEVRGTGARIKLITDGDVSAAISCAVQGTGVHAVMGIGGAPEGVITAAALRCLGGEIQARFRFRNDEERERARSMLGHADETTVFRTEDLAGGDAAGVRGDRRHGRRAAPGRPVLRRRRADPLAGDGLPDQAGPVRGHGPHVRPGPTAGRPAVERGRLAKGLVTRVGNRSGSGGDPGGGLSGSDTRTSPAIRSSSGVSFLWPGGAVATTGRSEASPSTCDIAVDPLEGTNLVRHGARAGRSPCSRPPRTAA